MPTYPIANRLVPVNQIHSNPDQPRKDFDPESLKELQDSINQRGLINPIAVCEMKNAPSHLMGEGGDGGGMNPSPQSSPARGEDGPHYMIIAGERRWRAYQALGLPEIDCRIWPAGTPTEEVELLSLTENLQRNDLNPIEEAKGYEVLTKAPYNQTQEDIAKAVGKPQSAISETIKLLNQPEEIRDFIARAIISPRHTRHLARIEDEKERIKWSKKAGQEGWSVKETEKRVNQLLGEGKQPHPASGHPLPKGEGRGEADDVPHGWSFRQVGSDTIVTAKFPRVTPLEDAAIEFKSSYMRWCEKHPYNLTKEETRSYQAAQRAKMDAAIAQAKAMGAIITPRDKPPAAPTQSSGIPKAETDGQTKQPPVAEVRQESDFIKRIKARRGIK